MGLQTTAARMAITAALAAVTVALGLIIPATPAMAAASPTVTLVSESGATIEKNKGRFTYKTKNATGKSAAVQAKLAGVWKDIGTAETVRSASTSRSVDYAFQKEGALDFRAVVKTGSKVSAVSKTVKVTYKKRVARNVKPSPKPVLKQALKPAPAVKDKAPKVTPVINLSPNYSIASTVPVKAFTFSGTGLSGAKIKLQRKSSTGSWRTVWTSKAQLASSVTVQHSHRFGTESTGTFRATAFKGGRTVAKSREVKLSYKRQSNVVYTMSNVAYGAGLFKTGLGRVAAGDRLSHDYQIWGARSSRKGVLQRIDGGRWVTVQTVWFTPENGFKVTVKTPVVQINAKKAYRFKVVATDQEKSWTSKRVTIKHVNPRSYTGYKAAAYNYMRGYCPSQILNLVGGPVSYTYFPSYLIEMSTQLGRGKSLQYVALHECAHIISYKLYADVFDSFTNRMNEIYGTSGSLGREHLADCMALAMGADPRWSGNYTRDCSGYRGEAARHVLAGHRP